VLLHHGELICIGESTDRGDIGRVGAELIFELLAA
jgi:hypothetical protein